LYLLKSIIQNYPKFTNFVNDPVVIIEFVQGIETIEPFLASNDLIPLFSFYPANYIFAGSRSLSIHTP
jgi:hypothetical protein